MASRCNGESALCRQDRNADEDDQGRQGALGPLRQVLLCKRRKTSLKVENFGRTSPARGGFQNLQEKPSARWPTSTFGARWPTQPQTRHEGRQRHKRRDGRQPCGFTCGDVWVLGIRRRNLLETFSIFRQVIQTCLKITLYNLKTLFPQVIRHVTSTRCSTFHASSWIRPQHTSNIINIIF